MICQDESSVLIRGFVCPNAQTKCSNSIGWFLCLLCSPLPIPDSQSSYIMWTQDRRRLQMQDDWSLPIEMDMEFQYEDTHSFDGTCDEW